MKDKTVHIADGKLIQQTDGVLFVGNGGRRIFFRGIRIYVGLFFIPRNTAFQFMGRIFVSRHWLKEGFSLSAFSHEYGHFMQQSRLGLFRYVFGVAIPSIWSLFRNPLTHPLRRFERHATLLGKRYVMNNSQ